MSEKIKAWTPNIYPHLVKTMDRHYSAGGIASDAQRYLDRGIKTDITTATETTALMASQPTHSDKPRSLESDKILADVQLQLLDLNKRLRQTHRRNPSIVDWKNRPLPPPALSPPHQIPNHPSTRPLLPPCLPRQPTHHPLSQLPTLSSGEHLVANDCSSGDNTQNPTKRTTRGQLPARFKDFVMCQKNKINNTHTNKQNKNTHASKH